MNILCIGDSLTYGYDVPLSQRWTNIVAKTLGVMITNEGICGDTTKGMAYRLDFLDLHKYDAFFLMGGSNDVLTDVPLAEITAQLTALTERFKATQKPVFLGIPPVTMPESAYYGWQAKADVQRHNTTLQELGVYIRLLAKEKGCYLIDCNEALQEDSSLYADGVHPNAAGYAKIAALVGKTFSPILSI